MDMGKYYKYCFLHRTEWGPKIMLERIVEIDKLPPGSYLERGRHDVWHCPYENNTIEGWQRWAKVRLAGSPVDFLTGHNRPGECDFLFEPKDIIF